MREMAWNSGSGSSRLMENAGIFCSNSMDVSIVFIVHRFILTITGLYHGCPSCYPDRELRVASNCTMDEKYQRTLDKEKFLSGSGYTLRTMWGCELDSELHDNKEMAEFFKDVSVIDPLNPRDAFFGGRTNPISLYYQPLVGEKLSYVDICR